MGDCEKNVRKKDPDQQSDFYLFPRPRPRGKPIFYVQFRDPSTREILTARSSGQTNESAAHRWAVREFAGMVDASGAAPRVDLTLRAWADRFYTEDCPHVSRLRLEGKHYSDRVMADHRGMVKNHLLGDAVAGIQLASLKRSDILAYRDRLVVKLGKSRSTQKLMAILKVILREALFRDLVLRDPTAGVGGLKIEVKERKAISPAQVLCLLRREHWEDELHWLGTWIAATTGLRAGEVRALQWGDLVPPRILVRRALSGDASVPDLPKWGKVRSCPYPKALQALLEARRGKGTAWVLSRGEGPIGYGYWARAVKDASEKAGLEGVTLHVLRHSLNTALRGGGTSDEQLRGAFGWTDPSTQEGYTHREAYDYSELGKDIDGLFGEIAEPSGT